MEFKRVKAVDEGVIQQEFDLHVAGEVVPGVLWSPVQTNPAPALIAMGHGGSQHKKSQDMRERAIRYATLFGWTN